MQGHAVAPDGGSALHDDEGAARDGGQRRQGLGGGDGQGDGDGVDDWIQLITSINLCCASPKCLLS